MLVFSKTESMTDKLRIFSVIWFLIAFGLLVYRWLDNKSWCRKFRDNIEITQEEDPEIVKTFQEVCSSLNIPMDKLSLQRNVLIDMPMAVGIMHPQVILPERDYTVEELGIIFYHELAHYKHRDLRCKILVVIVLMIHCFNPACFGLLQIVNVWSEYMADVSALETSNHLFTASQYFHKILDLIPDNKKKSGRERYLFSTLYKNDNALNMRVDFMKKYQKSKRVGKVVTAALTVSFVMLSTTMIFASSKIVADLHNIFYQNREGLIKETEKLVVADDGMIEHYCDVEDLDFEDLEEVSMPEQDIAALDLDVPCSIDWSINANTRYVSGFNTASKGEKIFVSVIMYPNDKDYWTGIIDDEGHVRYVEGKSIVAHNFIITETKKYRVFVQNNYKGGKTTLNASVFFACE